MRLASRDNWQTCLVVAWRIEHVKRLSRQHSEAPASVAFDAHECRVLAAYAKEHHHAIEVRDMNLQQATGLTGQLGGHLGRKRDGSPGSMMLRRGMQRLQSMTLGWRLAQGEITRAELLRAFAQWHHIDTS